MEFGVCQRCGKEDYLDEQNYCQTCAQNMDAELRGDEKKIGVCSNCGTEAYVNNENLCDNCITTQQSAFDTEGTCVNCAAETYVNAQGLCQNCHQQINNP